MKSRSATENDNQRPDRTIEGFEEILSKADKEALRTFLSHTTGGERERFSTAAIRWYKNASKGEIKELSPGVFGWEYHYGTPVAETSALAVMATADSEQLSKLNWGVVPEDDADLDWLARLKPGSLESFGDVLMQGNVFRFALVRELMRRELCLKPKSEQYIIGLIASGSRFVNISRGGMSLPDWLMSNPDILEEDIWRIFDIEGDQENSLAAIDKYSMNKPWSSTLLTLSNQGHLPRQRLLEASLDALSRGFNQFKSGWFSRFHEELQPSLEERAIMTERYARLLGSLASPTVSFAIKALEQIDKYHPLEEEILLKHLTPVLVSSTKSAVVAAIGMLERAVRRHEEFAGKACLMVVDALQHESPDVHNKVLYLLENWGNPANDELNRKVIGHMETVAASVRQRMQSWSEASLKSPKQPKQSPKEPSPKPRTSAVYLMEAAHACGWPLSCAPPVEPLESVELIISKAGYCLEHPDDADEIERVLDAIARLRVTADDSFKALSAPLKKRASKLLVSSAWSTQQFFSSQSLQLLFADFLRHWLDLSLNLEPEPLRTASLHPALRMMALRMFHILERLKCKTFLPLLSTATNLGGWIDPARFLEREKAWLEAKSIPDQYDLILALLRIPSSGLEALDISPLLKKQEVRNSLKYLTGVDAALIKKGSSLGMLACYFREPPGFEFIKGTIFEECSDIALLRWIAIACPTLRESFFAAGIRRAAPLLDYLSSDYRIIKVYFELLTNSGAPLEKKALTLLSIGLISPDPECCGLARDAVIIAIDERRLDLPKIACEISAYLHSQRSKPKRLAKSLHEIARVSELHAAAVVRIIELSLRGDPAQTSKELSSILELLHELLASQAAVLDDADARSYLQSIRRGGKTAQLAKQLLNHFFCLLVLNAIIYIFATGSLAANPTVAQGAKKQSLEERTLIFPGSASLGALSLIPYDGPSLGDPQHIGPAVGTVKISVPTGKLLFFELGPQAIAHPKLLDSCSAVGVDGLIINFIAMDDSEGGWCDAALQHADHFKNLKFLILNRSDVSDAGISQLKGQHDIECIRCVLTRVHGDCFKTFSQYKNLQYLDCANDTIKEENLKYLSDCPRLSSVDLRGNKLGDAGIKYLSRCSNLTELRIGCNPTVDEAGIKCLLNLKHLTYLDFDRSSITLSKLKELKPMHLDRLTVAEGTCPAKDLPILKTLAKKVSFAPRSKSSKESDVLLAPLH